MPTSGSWCSRGSEMLTAIRSCRFLQMAMARRTSPPNGEESLANATLIPGAGPPVRGRGQKVAHQEEDRRPLRHPADKLQRRLKVGGARDRLQRDQLAE